MKKHYVVLGIFGMCLLLVAGIWGGVVLGVPMEQQFFSVAAERGYKSRIDMGFLVERGSSAKIMIPEV